MQAMLQRKQRWTETMKSSQKVKWKPVFIETQEKACDFEGKGFLNKYVFFMTDKEFPPTLD